VIFSPTELKGAFIIEPELRADERGFFARTWCQDEFIQHGLNPRLVQCNISFNHKQGTWRGLHYQVAPFEEAKLVTCTRGAICDVIVDLRPESSTYKGYIAVTLSALNRKMLYVPERFAHGFITLEDNSEVFYQMSATYSAESGRGFRWNDPAFQIRLPQEVLVIADRDRNYPDFQAGQ
jgi:dTDP-4-dehydrorhamnose 3,5-epimerase